MGAYLYILPSGQAHIDGQAGALKMADNPRWKRRPPGSTWGDWGADDQLGRLNLLTSDKVLKAVAEVQEGRTFCLSMPLDYPGGTVVNPRRNPPQLTPTERNGMPNMTYPLRSAATTRASSTSSATTRCC